MFAASVLKVYIVLKSDIQEIRLRHWLRYDFG